MPWICFSDRRPVHEPQHKAVDHPDAPEGLQVLNAFEQ